MSYSFVDRPDKRSRWDELWMALMATAENGKAVQLPPDIKAVYGFFRPRAVKAGLRLRQRTVRGVRVAWCEPRKETR